MRELFSQKFRWIVYECGPINVEIPFLVRGTNPSYENRDFICISDFDKVLKWTTTSCLWFIGGRYHFCRATYFYPWASYLVPDISLLKEILPRAKSLFFNVVSKQLINLKWFSIGQFNGTPTNCECNFSFFFDILIGTPFSIVWHWQKPAFCY